MHVRCTNNESYIFLRSQTSFKLVGAGTSCKVVKNADYNEENM